LALPPKVAPTQVIVIPIGPAAKRDEVVSRARELMEQLKKSGIRVRIDDRDDQSPGWKFNEYEMRGVPLRLELGPRDMEKGQAVLVSRIDGEKRFVAQERLNEEVTAFLDEIQKKMFALAKQFMDDHFSAVDTIDELKTQIEEQRGFYLAGWCGSEACEHQVKEETGATSRNIPTEVKEHKGRCLVCQEEAKHTVVFARAY
jgi:prolyl-tRNA synthetase